MTCAEGIMRDTLTTGCPASLLLSVAVQGELNFPIWGSLVECWACGLCAAVTGEGVQVGEILREEPGQIIHSSGSS